MNIADIRKCVERLISRRYYTRRKVDELVSNLPSPEHNHDADYSPIGHNHDADYSPIGHNHDDRYYTETEADALLGGKSDVGHTHPGESAQLAIIQDRKTSGVDGGTFNSGAWRTRDLTLIFIDEIGISVSANQFTLPAGKYIISASAPAFFVARHQVRLRNVTDGQLYPGTSEYAVNTFPASQTRSFVNVATTITNINTFVLEHQCSITRNTNGLGLSSGSGFPVTFELYSEIVIWKL